MSHIKITPPKTFIQKCYKDKNGRVVFVQSPNAPIILWAICRLALFILSKDTLIYNVLDLVAFGSLFTWAWLEISSGSTYLRRLLGFVVVIYVVIGRL